jgi:hypothetical protein
LTFFLLSFTIEISKNEYLSKGEFDETITNTAYGLGFVSGGNTSGLHGFAGTKLRDKKRRSGNGFPGRPFFIVF